MRLGYVEAFAGISGDMMLSALVHAGVSADLLRETLTALELGATLEITEVDRSGIGALKVNVLVDGKPAEHAHEHDLEHGHEHGHGHSHHQHEARSLSSILALIGRAALPEPVRALASRTFEILGAAEAGIHRVPIESIHFHEVGAVDAIADIVLAAAGVHALGVEAWHCSPLNVGSGTVQCAHGRFPVPAPATAEILRGAPTYAAGPEMELVTPTGAALVRALGCNFGVAPAMVVHLIGYGAGTKNPPGFANVLRLCVGESSQPVSEATETVTVLEAAVDDLNPQVTAYVVERALKLGALDAMCTPVQMKKNRPGILITILAQAANVAALRDLLLRESTTLGVRMHEENRVCLERDHASVETPWGPVRIKRGHRDNEEFNAAPEFEDCRKIAESSGVPLKRVLETALRIYRGESR